MHYDKIQSLILQALEQTLDKKRPADGVLDKTFRKNRDLSSAERAAVARFFLGTICQRARLDYLLRAMPVSTKVQNDVHRARLALYLLSEKQTSLEETARISGIDPRPLQVLLGAPLWPSPDNPIQLLAAQRSLPDWLAQRWVEQFGYQQSDSLAQSVNKPGPLTIRVNALKCNRDQALAQLQEEGIVAQKTVFSPLGLHLLGRPNIFGSQAWRQGLFEVQDEGSQLIALLTSPKPQEKCVDFCAGSGGKTLALASQMNNRGEIWALDVDGSRLANLPPRLTRSGVSCVRYQLLPPSVPLPEGLKKADRVLVDAPCSSVGTLRRSPDLRWRLQPQDFSYFPSLQLEILLKASQCVRPEGLLVYATCSFDLAENEQVASKFEEQCPWFSRVNLSDLLVPELAQRFTAHRSPSAMHLFPHLHNTDGFFACAWRFYPSREQKM